MRAVATPRPALAFRPRLALRALIDRLVAADADYRARERLARLDERLLRDIGLTRDAVRRVPDGR